MARGRFRGINFRACPYFSMRASRLRSRIFLCALKAYVKACIDIVENASSSVRGIPIFPPIRVLYRMVSLFFICRRGSTHVATHIVASELSSDMPIALSRCKSGSKTSWHAGARNGRHEREGCRSDVKISDLCATPCTLQLRRVPSHPSTERLLAESVSVLIAGEADHAQLPVPSVGHLCCLSFQL